MLSAAGAAAIAMFGASPPAAAQVPAVTGVVNPPAGAETDTTLKVTDSIYIAVVGGQNLVVSVGDDGLLVSDDQDEPLVPRVRDQLAKISNRPVRYVVNSHWHFDHVGGNAAFAAGGAVTIAHENTRLRMLTEQYNPISDRRQRAFPAEFLPKLTFSESLTLHINGDDVVLRHMPAAHTDADVSIYFRGANVLALNDLYFIDENYPGMEVQSGANIDGLIAAYDSALAAIDDNTIVIPARGRLSNKAEVAEFRNILVTVRERVAAMVREGKSEAEVVAARPTREFDAKWNREQRRADNFVKAIYYTLKNE